ncbi:MAG: chromosome segregation protein SMC [Faecalibacterium sp. CAG:74_58_120]|nr:MAG: chromosome segregation protein SMC [Faecalibacterium sp. CAG:74_58_120]
MKLKKLELYGFKSFAQRTEIVFDEGITGIVGPNGSGKSNIGDAVRWVLGEQSAKTLRGASMSDVIFNGTQKRKPLSYCEVSLVFDNDDHALAMEAAEVMVTRRVYRNGESEYYLNRTACRLKDVVDLFRDTGIGKEGYSIIGQGRIDEILSRKSEDRRQVFEEAAGIVKFKARKEEADKKLQRTLENLERVDDILDELTKRLKPLEEQSRNARVYLELSTELKDLDLNLFLIRSDRARARLSELESELLTVQTILADTESNLTDKTTRRDETQNRIDQLEEAITRARTELMECAEHVHESQKKLSALQSRRETRSENRQRIVREQEEAQERLAEIEKDHVRIQADVEKQHSLIADAEQILRATQEAAEKAQAKEKEADAALETQKAAVIDQMNRLSDVRNDKTRLNTMQAQMETRLTEIEESSGALQEQEAALREALTAVEKQLETENQHQQQCQEKLAQARQASDEADTAYANLRADVEKQSADMQAAASRHNVLTEMTRDMEGYNMAVRRAMTYAKQRGLTGVKGVLAQLMTVPQAYETAIDMALGAAQQNIVTDTEETAKELINYLRQNRLGRATFLPMSAIRGKTLYGNERNALKLPGCLGVASELVQCAPEYRGIVENLLGRTVIADNLDHGIPIMRAGNHAFRLVTLEGDVMHSGGSMTGGSAQSKVSNLLSRERELKELTAKLQTGRAELDKCRQELTQCQQTAQEKRQKVSDAVNALHQQEIAVAREQARRESVFADLNTHLQRMQETEQARVQLHQSLEDIRQQLETIEHQRTGAQGDQSAMEQKTIEMQNALVKARAEASAENDRLMVRTLQLSDLRHGLSDLERDEAHAQQDQAQILREQERREQLLHEMDELDAIDENDMKREEAESARRQKEQLRQESAAQAIEQRRAQAQSDLRDILSDMENLHEAYNRDSEKLHKTELAKARIEGDQKNLQNRIWDTYKLTYAGAEEFRRTPFDEKESDCRAAELQGQIRALGTVNVGAVEEYAETKARVDDLTAQQQDLKRAEMDLRELIERLLIQMRSTFVENFSKMQGYFAETFMRLFGGGHAELKLMDPDDPLNCGIEVNAQPPGKKLQLLSLLSGGERALTAIAILFAMLKLKPTPFCILDEIEAALDDANIGYYADYLKEYSKGTQFIVVTHRKGTMERCNSLFGVAMEEQGVSRMVSVSLQDYQE